MIILSPNDWNSIAVSLRKRNEITLYRELGRARAEVSTVPGNSAWDSDMLVEVKLTNNGTFMRQYFKSAEDARRTMEGWMA